MNDKSRGAPEVASIVAGPSADRGDLENVPG